jgi:formylglycine-generating enzyme required for sulfatase activity
MLALAACAASPYPAGTGHRFRDRPFAPEMVVIPAGRFVMGATEAETTHAGRRAETAAWERPRHEVRVAMPLAVSRFLVTVAEYDYFVRASRYAVGRNCTVIAEGIWQAQSQRDYRDTGYAQTADHPVTCVTVADAEAYVGWLTKITGHQYRLPHEAEWEYAARAGTQESRWRGDDPVTLCQFANGADLSYERARPGEPNTNKACDDGYVFTNPVDALPANPWSLHDMLGNLWQWTADCFTPDYTAAPSVASLAITGGDCTQRVIRGGSWHNYPDALRSAARFALPNTLRSSSIGFRVLRQSGTTRP